MADPKKAPTADELNSAKAALKEIIDTTKGKDVELTDEQKERLTKDSEELKKFNKEHPKEFTELVNDTKRKPTEDKPNEMYLTEEERNNVNNNMKKSGIVKEQKGPQQPDGIMGFIMMLISMITGMQFPGQQQQQQDQQQDQQNPPPPPAADQPQPQPNQPQAEPKRKTVEEDIKALEDSQIYKDEKDPAEQQKLKDAVYKQHIKDDAKDWAKNVKGMDDANAEAYAQKQVDTAQKHADSHKADQQQGQSLATSAKAWQDHSDGRRDLQKQFDKYEESRGVKKDSTEYQKDWQDFVKKHDISNDDVSHATVGKATKELEARTELNKAVDKRIEQGMSKADAQKFKDQYKDKPIEEVEGLTKGWKESNDAAKKYREAFDKKMDAEGISKEAGQKMWDKMSKMPGTVENKIVNGKMEQKDGSYDKKVDEEIARLNSPDPNKNRDKEIEKAKDGIRLDADVQVAGGPDKPGAVLARGTDKEGNAVTISRNDKDELVAKRNDSQEIAKGEITLNEKASIDGKNFDAGAKFQVTDTKGHVTAPQVGGGGDKAAER